ncbi:hypothetical protein CL620_02990 [archaeon]|nr:hypothetical protein [archaeon]
MLGATAMGALAADLSDYPTMFVEDGVFNGLIVVGDAAQSVDTLGAVDIASNMMAPGSGSGSSVSVSGDAWLVKAGSDVMEFSESIGPATHGIVDFVDESELVALETLDFTNSKGTFRYEQFLHFDNAVINTTYEEDDDDTTDLFLKIPDSALFARYQLDFIESAKSDIDASDSFELEDYEGKSITMFGNTYEIVKAVTGGALSEKVTITMMTGPAGGTLQEGESRTFSIGDSSYTVELTFTDSSDRSKFVVNGESTNLMDEGDTYTLGDGTVLGLTETLHQNYAGGVHSAEFYLGADKIVLEDDGINASGSTDELQVNDETIDGADVEIVGSVTDEATSTTEDGELEIDTIYINMTAQDDYYLSAGETLLGQSELDEKDLLFTQNWDIRFEGLDGIEVDQIKLNDRAGEKEYELQFVNVNGDEISMPLAYASGSNLRWGDQNDNLTLTRNNIHDEQFFILNDDTDEDSVTHVVQYKGADDHTKSDPKIKFKILATGETVERTVTFGANSVSATLRLAGTTYTVTNSTTGTLGNTGSDDWGINVIGGSSTNTSITFGTANSTQNYLIARGGAKIELLQVNNAGIHAGNLTRGQFSVGSGQLHWNVTLIDSDRIDDRLSVPYLILGSNITAASSEVDLAAVTGGTGVSLTSPDDDSDNNYAYSVNGAWIKHTNPSGGGTTADTVNIDWPHEERAPLVYITSGATSSKVLAGDLAPVTVGVATRLASEVSDVMAQNLIVVGGPCANAAAAALLSSGADCAAGFTPGKAMIKLLEHSNGNMAMVVAGYTGADTRLAARVVATRWQELTGMEVEVEGTTSSDARIGAPSAAPAAPAADAAADDAAAEGDAAAE